MPSNLVILYRKKYFPLNKEILPRCDVEGDDTVRPEATHHLSVYRLRYGHHARGFPDSEVSAVGVSLRQDVEI